MNNDVNREEQIFQAAVQFPTPEQRAAYAQGACGNDDALRQRVEALLKAHEHAGGFLDQPPAVMASKTLVVTTAMLAVTEKPGDRIGRYKVLQQIGEGGCGVVYMAEQEEPVRRRVALKVIKLGMDTKSVIARFEAERQALALMDHPNIAKVLDAGAAERLQPLLAKNADAYRTVQAHMTLAMAQHQLNQLDQARVTLAKGLEIAEARFPKAGKASLDEQWHDWIIAHVLMREAKALIEGKSAQETK